MRILRQGTAATINMGPFVDATDGFTPETGLTAGGVDDFIISKNGGSSIDVSATATFTAKTDANGLYTVALTTSHTDTVGRLDIYVRDDSVCRPVMFSFFVLPANVYDAYIGSDLLQVDVTQIAGDVASDYVDTVDNVIRSNVIQILNDDTSASNMQKGAFVIEQLVAQASSTATQIISNSKMNTNDHYNGRTVIFTSGNLLRQQATITDYDGGTKTLTVSAMTQAPNNGDTFVIV